jgi:dihydrofolate reductase
MKASVFVGASLDGFIARPDGAFDFLALAEKEPHGYEQFIATVDAIVMGRNTYEVVLAFPDWPYGSVPVFVLSSRPLPPAPEGAVVERLHASPMEIFTELDSRGFEHAYIDGGVVIQSFLRAGLVSSVTITRVPVLIGSGIALFGALGTDVVLTHVSTRPLACGAVQSEYAIGPGSVHAGPV